MKKFLNFLKEFMEFENTGQSEANTLVKLSISKKSSPKGFRLLLNP